MTVQRYEPFRCEDWEMEKDDCGDYVLHSDYVALSEKLEAEFRATWAEHFMLSRECSRLQIEVAMLKALLEPRVVPVRVWQD